MWFSKKKQKNVSEIEILANYYRRNFSRRDRRKKLRSEREFNSDITLSGEDQSLVDPNSPNLMNNNYEALEKSLRFSFVDLFRHTKLPVKDCLPRKLDEFNGSDKENSIPPAQIEQIIDDNSSLQQSKELAVQKQKRRKTMKERIKGSKATLFVSEEDAPAKLTFRERLFGSRHSKSHKKSSSIQSGSLPLTPGLSSSVYEVQETLTQRYMSREDGYEKLFEDLDAIPFNLSVKEQERGFQQILSDVVQNFSPKKPNYWEHDKVGNTSIRFTSKEQFEASLEVESCNPYDIAKKSNQSKFQEFDNESDNQFSDSSLAESKVTRHKENKFLALTRKFSRKNRDNELPLEELSASVPTDDRTNEVDQKLCGSVFDVQPVFLRSPSSKLHDSFHFGNSSDSLHGEAILKFNVNKESIEKQNKLNNVEKYSNFIEVPTGTPPKFLDEDLQQFKKNQNELQHGSRSINSSDTTTQRSKEQISYQKTLNPAAIHFDTNIPDFMNESERFNKSLDTLNQNSFVENFYRKSYGQKEVLRSNTTKPKLLFSDIKQSENFGLSDLKGSKSAASNASNRYMLNNVIKDAEESVWGSSRANSIKSSFNGFTTQKSSIFDFKEIARKLEGATPEISRTSFSIKTDTIPHIEKFQKIIETNSLDTDVNPYTGLTNVKQREIEELRTQINRNRMQNYLFLNSKNS